MPDTFATYRRAAADRLLTCRVTGALWWDRFRGLHQLDTLQARREEADGGGYFRATSVKLMLDGVCETFTAAMGAPYLDGHGHATATPGRCSSSRTSWRRSPASSPTSASRCTSTRSATARSPRRSTRSPRCPTRCGSAAGITSRTCSSSEPADLERFAELGVIANFQPLWACKDEQNDQLTVPFVGHGAGRTGSTGSARCSGSGARVAFGSDWPVSSADPLQELHVAVNRMLSRPARRAGLGRDDHAAAARRGDQRATPRSTPSPGASPT